jgi:hypothetical protein
LLLGEEVSDGDAVSVGEEVSDWVGSEG